MLSNPDAKALADEIGKYVSGVANNSVGVFEEMTRSGRELDSDIAVFEVGDATNEAFKRVLEKWAKAFHYKETGIIVPANAHIHVAWFSNANVKDVPPGALYGRVHVLKRNGKNIGDQFMYITNNDPNRPNLGYYTAAFRRSFLAIMLVDFFGEIVGRGGTIDANNEQPP